MKETKLTDICSIQYGYPFDASLFSSVSEDGMPLIRIRDVKSGSTSTYYKGTVINEYIIRKGDFLIGMDGEFNIEPWKSEDALLNQRVCKIDSKSSDVSIRYIYRFLKKELKRIEDDTPFATVKHLSAKRLNQIQLPLPSLSEQEQIVAELDLISGIIEKKKQQLKELDSLAQSLFYEMFGNPVENEKGWEVKKLGEVANSVNYGTSSPANDGGRYTYLRMNNLTYTGYLDLDDVKRIDIPDKDLEKCIVRKGDILFNRTNSKELVGKTALFDLDEEMVIAGYIIRVRVNVENVLPIYVVRYMNLPFMKSYFSGLCKGAVNQANINSKELKAISILVPPLSLQQEFASRIEKIEKQKELIKQSLQETEILFNSRMNFYFN